MAWTTPRTWTDTELVTAAMMNPHIRDNFNAMGPHLIVRKSSDETFAATTTLQDDDDLKFTVAASEVWQFTLSLLVVTGTGGMKSAWAFPTSGVLTGLLLGADSGGSEFFQHQRQTVNDTPIVNYVTNSTGRLYRYEGVYENAGTGGTVQFRWAYTTASGTTTVKANSTLWAVKLA